MVKTIAIDGPAGAGKSTLARLLSQRLKFRYLDTGAMYRALTWYALEKNIDLEDEKTLTKLAQELEITFLPANSKGVCPLILANINITEKIREPLVSQNVSVVAKVKGVREAMVKQQRKMAKKGKIVLDGRDIGSKVLPNADIKFFVTASLEERAKRRLAELKEKNPNITIVDIKKEIAQRDKLDSEREVSPLIKTEDAILIDTSHLNIKEVLEKTLKIIKKKGEKR